MLIGTCLPVIAGCAMIWKSEWTHHAATPVIGYSITGFFGGTVSLIITVGMSNVAGHTKKSFMAATIFVAYCIGKEGSISPFFHSSFLLSALFKVGDMN
jgi:hypothetical protein